MFMKRYPWRGDHLELFFLFRLIFVILYLRSYRHVSHPLSLICYGDDHIVVTFKSHLIDLFNSSIFDISIDD